MPIVVGSAYIIELIISLTLIGGIFSLFHDYYIGLDNRIKSMGEDRFGVFKEGEGIYKKTYGNLEREYSKAKSEASKKYHVNNIHLITDFNTDFRDEVMWLARLRASQTYEDSIFKDISRDYIQNKKQVLEEFNSETKGIDTESKIRSIKEFSALKSRDQTSILEESEIISYNKQLAEYINDSRFYLQSIHGLIKRREIRNDVKRDQIEKIKTSLAHSNQDERLAMVAYINDALFDQLTSDKDFIIYKALQNPNYKYDRKPNYEYSGKLFVELWPVIGDILNDREYLSKHNIELFNSKAEAREWNERKCEIVEYMRDYGVKYGVKWEDRSMRRYGTVVSQLLYGTVLFSDEELQSGYEYMVVHNKSKLKEIPSKYPPKIFVQQSEQQDLINTEAAVNSVGAVEATNESDAFKPLKETEDKTADQSGAAEETNG